MYKTYETNFFFRHRYRRGRWLLPTNALQCRKVFRLSLVCSRGVNCFGISEQNCFHTRRAL